MQKTTIANNLSNPQKKIPRPFSSLFKTWFLRIFVIGIIAVGLYFLLQGFDFQQLKRSLKKALWAPLILGIFVNFLALSNKSVFWYICLSKHYQLPFISMLRYTFATFATSIVAPMRAGELLRLWLLHKHHQVPIAIAVCVALIEKYFDILALFLVTSPMPWFIGEPLPLWLIHGIRFCHPLILSALLALWLLWQWLHYQMLNYPEQQPAAQHPHILYRSLHTLRRRILPHHLHLRASLKVLYLPLASLFVTILALCAAWLCESLLIRLVFYSLAIPMTWQACMFLLFSINLAIAIPSTPGHVGALELGALTGCNLLGIAKEDALAFALIYHVIQIVPLLLLSFLDLRFILRQSPQTDPQFVKESASF